MRVLKTVEALVRYQSKSYNEMVANTNVKLYGISILIFIDIDLSAADRC